VNNSAVGCKYQRRFAPKKPRLFASLHGIGVKYSKQYQSARVGSHRHQQGDGVITLQQQQSAEVNLENVQCSAVHSKEQSAVVELVELQQGVGFISPLQKIVLCTSQPESAADITTEQQQKSVQVKTEQPVQSMVETLLRIDSASSCRYLNLMSTRYAKAIQV